jgi:hypothetical protein
MFDWFAARPEPEGAPPVDRPSVPLTAAEREAFESISDHLDDTAPATARLRRLSFDPSWCTLPVGIVVLVAGMAWTILWLGTSVAVSFAGVVIQAVAAGIIVRSQRDRISAMTSGTTGTGASDPAGHPLQHRGPRP